MGIANTPVIIGVGQSVDRIDAPDYHAWSAPDLAAAAARAALLDTGVQQAALLDRIDALVTTRTFEDSYAAPAIFGKSSNFPRSVAARLGIAPRRAIWSSGGGNSPQDLVNEFCERVAADEFEIVLLCGGEAISTVRHAQRNGQSLDFAEQPDGEVEDRGSGFEKYRERLAQQHGIVNAAIGYALAENARRSRLGLTRTEYSQAMGSLFAPFAAVAHENPMSAWAVPAFSPDELITVTQSNRLVSDPYPRHLVSRDQVNMGAAVIIASRRVAEEFGVARERMVYLHGYAQAMEKPLLSRPDLGASPAAQQVARAALDRAGSITSDMTAFDFYSCFPIAVSNVAIDALGLAADDPRGLTATGGLPYFGGPGNNYSMHAIAEMVQKVRAMPGKSGFVGANGGYLSAYSAGVYSTTPRPWRDWSSADLQASLDAMPSMETIGDYTGPGTVETYTIFYLKGLPQYAVVLGRTRDGQRFIARTGDGDLASVAAMHDSDPLGRAIVARADPGKATIFCFEPHH